jgi:hypothetical protein
MIVSIRSLSLHPGRFCRCHSAKHVSAQVNSCSRYKLPLNRRSSGSEAIVANVLARFTPRNLSASRLARTSTRHLPRPNPHS